MRSGCRMWVGLSPCLAIARHMRDEEYPVRGDRVGTGLMDGAEHDEQQQDGRETVVQQVNDKGHPSVLGALEDEGDSRAEDEVHDHIPRIEDGVEGCPQRAVHQPGPLSVYLLLPR